MKTIQIKKPQIKINNGLARMNVEIIEDGVSKIVFYEVEEQYKDLLTPERGDAFVSLVLPVAFREGYDVECDVPVSSYFLHNVKELLMPHLLLYDKSIKNININCKTTSEKLENSCSGVGTGVSCGVDSMYAIMKYEKSKYDNNRLTHLFIGSVNVELWDFDEENDDLYSWEAAHKDQFDRFYYVSEHTGAPLIKIFTNSIWYICKRNWENYHHLYTHYYITMSTVLSVKRLWEGGGYIFASTFDDLGQFVLDNNSKHDPAAYELLMLMTYSGNDFFLMSGGRNK